jgi:hypothetical protein
MVVVQKEWGHLARPPALLDAPSPEPVAVYAQSTLQLPDAGLTQYECGCMIPLLCSK